MPESTGSCKVLLTGATGFVGRYVLRELLERGYAPVCLVRDETKLMEHLEPAERDRITAVKGDILQPQTIRSAATGCRHAIHLVGIIMERGEQTFSRIHYEGVKNMVSAMKECGIDRTIHMSALGSRSDATTKYHQTKYIAEEYVRGSGLSWTIFQPSLIHGPEAEFMQLMKTLACGAFIPAMPYFGDGSARIQPVDVRDVAECMVKALGNPKTVRQSYALGGPRTYSWKEFYQLCQRLLPGAKKWKPLISQPVWLAKAMATTVMKVPLPVEKLDKLRFDVDQIQMTQEDNICDIAPAERDFDITFRDFETELGRYAEQI